MYTTVIYDTTANANIHHQTGNTVASLLLDPKGRTLPSDPKAIEGLMYRNPATRNR